MGGKSLKSNHSKSSLGRVKYGQNGLRKKECKLIISRLINDLMKNMIAKKSSNQVISKKRVTDHGEVFTSEYEVNAMLDLVKRETERIDSRFLEPACGTGNFLVEILRRKLEIVEKKYKKNQIEFERYTAIAVSSIYGVDIQNDSVQKCRKRLFRIFDKKYTFLYKKRCKESFRKTIRFILRKNIIWGDALTLKKPNEKSNSIMFSEWSLVKSNLIKRRDYYFSELTPKEVLDLLSEHLISDTGTPAFIPQPFREFPLTHYLKLYEAIY